MVHPWVLAGLRGTPLLQAQGKVARLAWGPTRDFHGEMVGSWGVNRELVVMAGRRKHC